MRLVAPFVAILLAVSACTSAANNDVAASPSSATSASAPANQPTPTPRNMTFVSPKSIMTSDGNNVFMEVDEPFACVREIAVTVRGFTPNGTTIVEIKSIDDTHGASQKISNDKDGTARTSLLCTGYAPGGYMLTMSDESSKKWARVPFASIA